MMDPTRLAILIPLINSVIYYVLSFVIVRLLFIKLNKKHVSLQNFAHVILKHSNSTINFGDYLGTSKHISGKMDVERNHIKARYIVPSHLCHENDKKGKYLDLGAVLALADEVTTVLIVCSDSDYRPGVSVTLSGELYSNKIYAGQTVVIEATVTKLGATLGFVEVTNRELLNFNEYNSLI